MLNSYLTVIDILDFFKETLCGVPGQCDIFFGEDEVVADIVAPAFPDCIQVFNDDEDCLK